MGKNERQAYLKAIRARYRRAKKRANEIQRRYKRDTKEIQKRYKRDTKEIQKRYKRYKGQSSIKNT